MPVLPVIDGLIVLGWTSLMAGFLLKAVYMTTTYRPRPLGLVPNDFVTFAVVCLLFAVALAARTWVKRQEPLRVLRPRSRASELEDREEGAARPIAVER